MTYVFDCRYIWKLVFGLEVSWFSVAAVIYCLTFPVTTKASCLHGVVVLTDVTLDLKTCHKKSSSSES